MPTFLLLTHPGQANPNSNPNPNQAKALVTGGCINIEMFPPGHYYSSKDEGNGNGGLTLTYT